ncbi:hypothetical protein Daus18300_010504 [Diaporthe australafricana]|uniref:NmrA-like domain-containing protein n=1 Tax=Diaporthe australafricana TaxID=127596 RepID=A0ABR3WAC9_9PEZI
MSRAVLVTGATGKQGGAVVKSLIQAKTDFKIFAVTRNTSSPAAQKLGDLSSNVSLVQGDLDDPAAIFENAKKVASVPICGVYSMQTPMIKGQTVDIEIKQGKALIDESLRNGVDHFVYSSVDRGGEKRSFDNPTPVPHFASKHRVEQYLLEKTSGGSMGWTILRPTGFMDNYVPGSMAKIFFTAWKVNINKEAPQQLIAVSDIGHFAARALMFPEKYKGRAISLAGDELTFDQAAAVFKQRIGQNMPTTFGLVASLALWAAKDIGTMFKWMNDDGFGANVEELRKEHPELMDFGTYLEFHSGFGPN